MQQQSDVAGAGFWCPPELAPVIDLFVRTIGTPGRGTPPALLVWGPTGYGKTSALGHVEQRAHDNGIGVIRGLVPVAPVAEGGPALRLVDDAHDLDPDQAGALSRDAAHGRALLLAARPWPDSEVLTALMTALPGYRGISLATWDTAAVAAYLRASGMTSPDLSAHARRLQELGGGLPWLVSGLVAAGPSATHRDVAGPVRARVHGLPPEALDLVEQLAVGFGVDDCPQTAVTSPDRLDEIFVEADAAGLLTPAGDLPPAVARIVAEDLPIHRRRRLQREVVTTLPAVATTDPRRYRRVASTGLRDPRLAAGLVEIGDDLLAVDPTAAQTCYDLAERAGTAPEALLARRAEAALRVGDLDRAGALADEALALPEPAEPRRTARVALALLGQTGIGAPVTQAAEWLGPAPNATETFAAMVVLLGQGHRDEAEQLATRHRRAAALPTLREGAATLSLRGLEATFDDTPTDALTDLVQAALTLPTDGHDALLPAHPAVLAALVALHTGDLASATSVLDRARDRLDPASRWYRRLTQLAAWARLQAGELALAEELRRAATGSPWPLSSRDALWDVALAVALARRGDNARGLAEEWARVGDVLLGHPVGLYDLLPLGELHVASARVHRPEVVLPYLRQAWATLETLGMPPLWATSLHWDAIQAAILANRPKDIAPHATALVRASTVLPYAATLAAVGKVWVRVMAESFTVGEVIAAAQRLRECGQLWEGRRLVGHAAARADDRKDTALLLECARELGSPGPEPGPTGGGQAGDSRTVQLPSGRVHLSGREQQVARLVVAGHTYREVGEQLFLSERTVEHHVARIRQRFGVRSRAELLEHLKDALDQLSDHRG